MENNVVTLDTAKKLKAAGFPQSTEFTWYCDEERDDTPVLNWTDLRRVVGGVGFTDAQYAAPCTQEIADQLPTTIQKDDAVYNLELCKLFHAGMDSEPEWWACYEYYDLSIHDYSGPTMVEALAALWLELQTPKTSP